MLRVSFQVYLSNGRAVSEADLAADGGELRAALAASPGAEGVIVLEDADRSVREVLLDTLTPLMNDVCFAAPPRLLGGQTAVYDFAAYNERAQLIPEGDQVLVTGDAVGPQRFNLRELAEGLVACGERYVTFRQSLHPDEDLSILLRRAAQARAALASA